MPLTDLKSFPCCPPAHEIKIFIINKDSKPWSDTHGP